MIQLSVLKASFASERLIYAPTKFENVKQRLDRAEVMDRERDTRWERSKGIPHQGCRETASGLQYLNSRELFARENGARYEAMARLPRCPLSISMSDTSPREFGTME